MINFGGSISRCSRIPTIRSASRIADISGVVIIIASSAATIEFSNPCSIPAGESMIM